MATNHEITGSSPVRGTKERRKVMPNRNGTGPDGNGPDGRRLGPCSTDKKDSPTEPRRNIRRSRGRRNQRGRNEGSSII